MERIPKIAFQQVMRHVPKSLILPTPLRILNKIHLIWKLTLKYKIYTNRDNFPSLVAGHIIHLTLGRRKWVQIVAQCVLICRRILDCAEQYKRTAAAYQRFKHAWRNTYGVPGKIPKGPYFLFKMHYLAERLIFVVKSLFQLLIENFKWSARLWDAIEALSFSASTRNERTQELFVNCFACMRTIGKGGLVQEVRNHRAILDGLFSAIGSRWKAEVLLGTLETAAIIFEPMPAEEPPPPKNSFIPKDGITLTI